MRSFFQSTLDHLKSALQKSANAVDFTALEPSDISFYAKENLGRKRDTMPQIEDFDKVLMHFSNAVNKGCGVNKVRKKLSSLKPAQNEINVEKVQKMYDDGYDWKSRKYLISKDNYIMDGHHAYALGLQLEPDSEVDCYRVNLKGQELLRRLNLMKASKNLDLNDNITKAFMNLLGA